MEQISSVNGLPAHLLAVTPQPRCSKCGFVFTGAFRESILQRMASPESTAFDQYLCATCTQDAEIVHETANDACPACCGEGVIEEEYGFSWSLEPSYITGRCEACRGTGKINPTDDDELTPQAIAATCEPDEGSGI